MTEHEASRTLVKSPPELWAECSDAASLARHLGEFGEIKITRLDPETAVAWEGECASGTVRIEPSAWGTRVTLTAQTEGAEVVSGAEAESEAASAEPEEPVEAEAKAEVEEAEAVSAEPEPAAEAEVEAVAEAPRPIPPPMASQRPGGLMARLRARFRAATAPPPSGGIALPPMPSAAPPIPVAPAVPEPVVEPGPVVEPEPVAAEPMAAEPTAESTPNLDAEAVLTAALDSLGQAHHRPYSRS